MATVEYKKQKPKNQMNNDMTSTVLSSCTLVFFLSADNQPDDSFFSKLDSSLKKNTAFVKKLVGFISWYYSLCWNGVVLEILPSVYMCIV